MPLREHIFSSMFVCGRVAIQQYILTFIWISHTRTAYFIMILRKYTEKK